MAAAGSMSDSAQLRCSLMEFAPRSDVAAALGQPAHVALSQSVQASGLAAVSIALIIDQMVQPNLCVTRTAAGWARIAITATADTEPDAVAAQVKAAIRMLSAIADRPYRLDSVAVCGPDLRGSGAPLQRAARRAWEAHYAPEQLECKAEHAVVGPAKPVAQAALSRVLARIAAGGGAPDFSAAAPQRRRAACNFIATTHGNLGLSPAEVEAVRVQLAQV